MVFGSFGCDYTLLRKRKENNVNFPTYVIISGNGVNFSTFVIILYNPMWKLE
jgi:hypothetical protein